MKDQKRNSRLSEIPVELVVIVLENLAGFDSLFAAIQTCRRLYNCFGDNSARIINSISSNIYQRAIQLDYLAEPFPYQGSCLIIQQLNFVIKNRYMRRDFVLQMFKDAWSYLFDKGLEELLIPLGRKLAWSLELNNRRQDAVGILQQILRGQPPFKVSSTKLAGKAAAFRRPEKYVRRAPTFAPIDSLMLRFHQEAETLPEEAVFKVNKKRVYSKYNKLRRLPVAIITDDGMVFFQSTTHLPEGIYSECGITLVRLTNPPWRVHGWSELKNVIQPRPRLRPLLNILNGLRITTQLEDMSYLDSARF